MLIAYLLASKFSVLGQVVGFDEVHGNLRVSAIKIANLSSLGNCEVLKSMWEIEIK